MAQRPLRSSRFGLGPWEVDLAVGTAVSTRDVVTLTATESRLMGRLREADGEPVGREVLLREVWEYASTVRSRTVDTTLRRLRDKLEPDRDSPCLLITHRGQGIALASVREARSLPSPTRLVRRSTPTRLIGRDADVARVVDAVDRPAWVTVVGTAGVGKSALAQVVADRWDDGSRSALVVSITGCSTAAAVETAIRRVIDGGRSERLLSELFSDLAEPLLVLDGADALAAVEAVALESLTDVVRVLVTRQAPFGLSTEQQVRVHPLGEQDAGALVVGLAEQRDADLDSDTVDTVVRASGGLPLAIELAVPIASVAGAAGLQGTHWHHIGEDGGLSAALDRAVGALDDAARNLLVDLTAFSGAFDVAAASGLSPDALGPLMRLHERGLVAGRGEMRLLSPVRVHAGPPPAKAVAARNAWLASLGAHDLLVAERGQRYRADLMAALAGSTSPGRLAWALVGVGRECGFGLDILDALRGAQERHPDDALAAASLVGALYFREGHTDALEGRAARIEGAPGVWTRALLARDPAAIEPLVTEGVGLIRDAGLPIGVSGVMRADVLGRDPDLRRSLSALRSLRAEVSGAPQLHARLAALIALVELRLGRIASARRRLEEIPRIDEPHIAVIQGILAVLDGDPAAAMAPFDQARDQFAQRGDRSGVGSAMAYRDLVAWATQAELTGVDGPPLTPGPESLRRFVADPAGMPVERLPDPDARRVVHAWRAGETLPDDVRGWPVRVLKTLLQRVAGPR